MAMMEPELAVLDETDSGLDIDALKIVANGVVKCSNYCLSGVTKWYNCFLLGCA